MASEMIRMVRVGSEIALMLRANGEPGWAQLIEDRVNRIADAATGEARDDAVRDLLLMYQGGMGSFNDLVLQSLTGPLSSNDRLDYLRQELFVLTVSFLDRK